MTTVTPIAMKYIENVNAKGDVNNANINNDEKDGEDGEDGKADVGEVEDDQVDSYVTISAII